MLHGLLCVSLTVLLITGCSGLLQDDRDTFGHGEAERWELMESEFAEQWPDETEFDADIFKCWPSLIDEPADDGLWLVCDAGTAPVLEGHTCRLYLQDFISDPRAVCE